MGLDGTINGCEDWISDDIWLGAHRCPEQYVTAPWQQSKSYQICASGVAAS